MTATLSAQSTSIVPPVVAGAAQAAQTATLAGAPLLVPHLRLQVVSIAPALVYGAVTSSQARTLVAGLIGAPHVRFLACAGGSGAARGVQAQALAASVTTGPIPRAVQTQSVQAWPTLVLPGAFALPVPRRSLSGAALLGLSGGAGPRQAAFLIAGVNPLQEGAQPAQQGTLAAQSRVIVPLQSGAQALATRTLASGTMTLAHPLMGLGVALWWAQARSTALLRAALGVLAPHGDYRSARGLRNGAYQFRSASIGGDAVSALAVPPTPQVVTLRSTERDRLFRLNFAGDLPAGDTVASASITVTAQPEQYEPAAQTDVTASLLRSHSCVGTTVLLYLGNANTTVSTQYTVRVVMTSAGGLVLHETIDPIICDM